MANKLLSAAVRSVLFTSAVAAAGYPAYVTAQEGVDTELEEVVVTGSLIPQDLNAPGVPVTLMTSDQIGPETGILHDPFYFPGPTSGFGLGFAVRTSAPPGTTWPLGEYRWDGAGGSFYFVDPQDDMLVVFMVQAMTQGGRIQLALKTLIYEAMGKGARKVRPSPD